ncbi:MAG: hypothetical protein RRY34_07930, partial [Victivallaceae bacterium]
MNLTADDNPGNCDTSHNYGDEFYECNISNATIDFKSPCFFIKSMLIHPWNGYLSGNYGSENSGSFYKIAGGGVDNPKFYCNIVKVCKRCGFKEERSGMGAEGIGDWVSNATRFYSGDSTTITVPHHKKFNDPFAFQAQASVTLSSIGYFHDAACAVRSSGSCGNPLTPYEKFVLDGESNLTSDCKNYYNAKSIVVPLNEFDPNKFELFVSGYGTVNVGDC